MKHLLLVSLFLLMASTCLAQAKWEGALKGSIEGEVRISDNMTKTLSGNISGKWQAVTHEDGTISGNATGSFGALDNAADYGFSGRFEVTYDSATNRLTGTWSMPGLAEHNEIAFDIDEVAGKIEGPINGKVHTERGPLDFSGKINLELLGLSQELRGTVNGGLSIRIGWEAMGRDSSSCGEGAVQDDHGILKGNWHATINDDRTISGEANGIFQGTATLSVTPKDTPCIAPELTNLLNMGGLGIDIPPIIVNFPYYGTWSGTLSGDPVQGFYFGGSWTESYDHEHYNSFGAGFQEMSFTTDGIQEGLGGNIKIAIEPGESFPFPISGSVKGGGTVEVNLREMAREQGICTRYKDLFNQLPPITRSNAQQGPPYSMYKDLFDQLPTDDFMNGNNQFDQLPLDFMPECVSNGDICDCLPEFITVNWWTEEVNISGEFNHSETLND